MQIKEWMTPAPLTVSPATPVAKAHDLMLYRRIRHLPVVDDGRLVGIITDRDIRTVLPSPATSFSVGEIRFLLDKLKVGEVMTRSVVTVAPHERLADAVRLMLDNKFGSLPVVDDGQLVGIVTDLDLLRALGSSLGVPGATVAPQEGAEAGGKKILVPLDGTAGSEVVLSKVAELARADGTAVCLLHVSAPAKEIRADGRVVVYADQETARIEAEVHAYFRRLATALGDVAVEFCVRFGDPIEEIVREAEDGKCTLIAMATHRRTGFSRFVKGSVAEEVERITRVPVMLVRYGAAAV
jgi:CBS domain-containing protein/nucleotide-binding universal stress UspA family protein